MKRRRRRRRRRVLAAAQCNGQTRGRNEQARQHRYGGGEGHSVGPRFRLHRPGFKLRHLRSQRLPRGRVPLQLRRYGLRACFRFPHRCSLRLGVLSVCLFQVFQHGAVASVHLHHVELGDVRADFEALDHVHHRLENAVVVGRRTPAGLLLEAACRLLGNRRLHLLLHLFFEPRKTQTLQTHVHRRRRGLDLLFHLLFHRLRRGCCCCCCCRRCCFPRRRRCWGGGGG
mmetsp:Transcript_3899/g.8342  ORF Transcript_3899/g.8342 Transcript_3899/m.8342 type:complete len:228 (-) Transcript_3899:218-901(-)